MLGTTYIKGKRELSFEIKVHSNFPEPHIYKTIKGYAENEEKAKELAFYWSLVYKYDSIELIIKQKNEQKKRTQSKADGHQIRQ